MFTKVKSSSLAAATALAALLICGQATQAATTVSYLIVPPSGNLAGALNDGPQVFTLPGYGNVEVSLTNPVPSPIGATFFDQINAYNQQTNNTLYNWGTDTQRFDIYNGVAGATEQYHFNFAFLSGAPNPADLYLVVAGLARGTTVTTSQSGNLVGEYTFPNSGFYPSGPSSTTLYGSAGPNTFSSLVDADPLNTGWALWQPSAPLLTTTSSIPFISLDVVQPYPDGIGFTLAYTAVPEPASLGLLSAGAVLLFRRQRRSSSVQNS